MTKITFLQRNGAFWGFRESGHTGFGEEGDDILCSAISAMTMMILNTLELSYECPVDYKIDEETTYITVKCPAALPDSGADEKRRFASSGLIQGYFYQLNDLTDEYFDFLEVDVADE